MSTTATMAYMAGSEGIGKAIELKNAGKDVHLYCLGTMRTTDIPRDAYDNETPEWYSVYIESDMHPDSFLVYMENLNLQDARIIIGNLEHAISATCEFTQTETKRTLKINHATTE